MKRRDVLTASGATLALLSTNSLRANSTLSARRATITLTAVGDCVITRRLATIQDEDFLAIARLVRISDCAIGNCEMAFGDVTRLDPMPKGIDVNMICEPFGAQELAWMGLDMVGCANNHIMDYGRPGLESTLDALRKAGIITAGAAFSLSQAAEPSYFDSPAGRVALVNCASTFPEWSLAANSSHNSNARAGVNPIRLDLAYSLEPRLIDQLLSINSALFPNSARIDVSKVSEVTVFGRRFSVGKNAADTPASPIDVERVLNSIRSARQKADIVCLLIHTHGNAGPGGFLQKLAHSCIDAGADIFLCSGSHQIDGIEIYRSKPVFYGLGNFIFQYDTIESIPAEVHQSLEQAFSASDVAEGTSILSDYIFTESVSWESIVPRIKFTHQKLAEIALHPIVLGFEEARYSRGVPRIAKGHSAQSILERAAELSRPFGTHLDIGKGTATVKI